MSFQEFNLTLDKAYKAIKRLAKSIHWQSLYANVRELHFKMFVNDRDLSSLQLDFLRTISYYYDVTTDVSCGTVHEIVLKEDIYVDAYQHYKSSKNKKESKRVEKENVSSSRAQKFKDKYKQSDQWIFK